MTRDAENVIVDAGYITENVIVIVIDGQRYSEGWGDTSHQYIPRIAGQIAPSGVVNTHFYNNGPTYTLAGHTAITTGYYQEIDNSGNEFPVYPSFFQYWNTKCQKAKENSWVIASKDKLEVLDNCLYASYHDLYRPSADCGINGLGSGYRHDSITVKTVMKILNEYHPHLVLVNFREPDFSAHAGSWDNYIQGVKTPDEYAFQIWQYIQEDKHYKGKTSMFITNDHGRHLDSVADGFISHGDGCLGCRHVNLFAYGPDFKEDAVVNTQRELIDICATISELLGFEMEFSQGEVMHELFR